MSGNIRQITADNINDTPSKRRHENSRRLSRGNNRNRQTPASREEWAEVLATADKYY
jgi:hypothetical protein